MHAVEMNNESIIAASIHFFTHFTKHISTVDVVEGFCVDKAFVRAADAFSWFRWV